MKLSLFLALALLLVLPLAAGELSITVTDSDTVHSTLRLDLMEWARHPTDATGCNSTDCCIAPADDTKCAAMAQAFLQNPDQVTRKIYACIQQDPAWACHLEISRGEPLMYCQTIPVAVAREVDVAGCVSELAAIEF